MYEHLAPVANAWSDRLSGNTPTFPATLEELLERCRAARQERPTPLILRYRPGDWNALHQDLYGEVYFPFQVLSVLSDPGEYTGGEFVLVEQRPRARPELEVPAMAEHGPRHKWMLCSQGWTHLRACRVLRLDDRRARRWEQRRRGGLLLDEDPGSGHPVHGLMPGEIEAILELFAKWGEIDCSHRSSLTAAPTSSWCGSRRPTSGAF